MNKIYIVGLGAGDLDQLSVKIYRKLLKEELPLFLRTKEHPVVDDLIKEGVTFTSFDSVYEEKKDFEEVYDKIVEILLSEVEKSSLLYAVPGHPMVAEQTVQKLLAQKATPVEIIGGQSFIDDLFSALKIDPVEGFQFLDGTNVNREMIEYRNHLIISQVYDEFIASEVKLTLLEDLPYDYEVYIVEAAGSSLEKITKVPLEDLDRAVSVNNLTSVYVPPAAPELLRHQFTELRQIIRTLRGPDGCPWDRKQTHESLKRYAIEEVYELLAAIDEEDDEAIIEELGDVLLQVMLHSQIGEDQGYFTIDDVIKTLSKKMIYRHPHAFDKLSNPTVEEVHETWEKLKQKEKNKDQQSILDDIPNNLPSLAKAFELQKEAAKVGFDWKDVRPMWDKLSEELKEIKEAIENRDEQEMEAEFGDVLFVIVNIMRFYDIHPEVALHRTNEKFTRRFNYIEEEIRKRGKKLGSVSLEEMDQYWDEAKERGK